MENKEFNLKDKIRKWLDYEEEMIDVEDVKEFIRLESHLLQEYILGNIIWEDMCDKRKKLIREDLQ